MLNLMIVGCMIFKQISISISIFILSICSSYAKYSVSNSGKEQIKKYEICKLTAYWDSNGYSIGYGHHSKSVKKGQKITKAQANKYFNEDIKDVNESINRLVKDLNPKLKLSQAFIDGLGDLIYNCGEGGVQKSEFWKRMKNCRPGNKNDYKFSIAAVKNCRVSCKGHIKRRYETHVRMLS